MAGILGIIDMVKNAAGRGIQKVKENPELLSTLDSSSAELFNKGINPNTKSPTPAKKTNYVLIIGVAIAGLIVLGIIIYKTK